MSDEDLPVAESTYRTLLAAGNKTRQEAANLVRELRTKTRNKGTRPREIEVAQADAWLAICALSTSLDTDLETEPAIWTRAIRRTEEWRNMIS